MWSRINTALLVLIIAINAYVVTAPLMPKLWLWWQRQHTHAVTTLTRRIHASTAEPLTTPTLQPNTLIIPKIALSQSLHEGTNAYAVLAKGIWRWPYGSTPDKGGNTVLIGHRFTYTNPRGVFYFLGDIRAGDELGIVWDNKTYAYRVAEVKVVPPTDLSIEAPTRIPTVTMYTCTPLWWPKDRLVVVAHPEAAP